MIDFGKIVLIVGFVVGFPLMSLAGGTVEPTDLRAEDLALFLGVHWRAFDYTPPEGVDVVGHELVTYAEGRATVVRPFPRRITSSGKATRRVAVLYRESPDRSRLETTTRIDGFSAVGPIENPFAGLRMQTQERSVVDAQGRMVLAIALEPGDTTVDAEDKMPETAYRCLVLRILTEKSAGALDFKARQKQLFYEIDHKAVYDACQELMRLCREGELSARAYHCDDPPEKLRQVPEAIGAIEPTSIAINELMISLIFVSEDGTQHLRCVSNEFGEPPADDGAKGLGFRTEPYAMDRLTGDESLDTLNERYAHFQMSLYPGLQYECSGDEGPTTVDGAKEMAESLAGIADLVRTMGTELAVKRQRLLHRVDHQKLLAACRLVLKRHDEGVFSSDKIHLVPEDLKNEMQNTVEYRQTQENIEHIPEIILRLEPGYIWFLDDGVMVAIAGGLGHAGVIAYPDDAERELRDDQMKLIDGLLYYDDGLQEVGPEYKEYLQSLRDEAIVYIDWMRKQQNLPLPKQTPVN